MEYRKRLCDLVNLEENSKECVILTLKPETTPLDLIRLGGFDGTEYMFRMSKDPRTTCISIFREGQPPYHLDYGSKVTLAGEDQLKVRNLVMECVNFDFGIFTHGGIEMHFDSLVEDTLGERTLDSTRSFTLKSGDGCSLFVNDMIIAHPKDDTKLDIWLTDHNARLEITSTEQHGHVTVDRGFVRRVYTPEVALETELLSERGRFDLALDRALGAFSGKTGWQGLDAPSAVESFVRFAKKDGAFLDISLDSAKEKAREKAKEKNAARNMRARSKKRPEHER